MRLENLGVMRATLSKRLNKNELKLTYGTFQIRDKDVAITSWYILQNIYCERTIIKKCLYFT